jgi:polyhydroxybutyrate depolymerase
MRDAFVLLVLVSCGGTESTPNDGGPDATEDATLDVTQTQDAGADVSAFDGAADASACGTRTGKRGLTSRTMNGRTYEVYVPQSLDPKTSVPFVVVHHGYTMSGDTMRVITQYSALADQEGIAVAFPDGEGGPNSFGAPWNVGQGNCPSTTGPVPVATGDDFAFDEAMRADVEQDQCIDEKHTFVTGFSMGGYFSHHIGCMRPDFARAVAPHSAGTHDFSTCVAGHEPIIVFHGDSDPIISVSCDDAAVQQWITKNSCQTTGSAVQVKGGTCTYYDGCPADGQVAYCKFSGLGHAWAGGASDGGVFSNPNYEPATQLEWAFFKKYAW